MKMYESTIDPLCDDLYDICDTCHFRHNCDLLSSGQVSQCHTVITQLGENYPTESRLDERLEACFEKMMIKSRKIAR